MQKDAASWPKVLVPLTRPRHEQANLTSAEELEFFRIVWRDCDWGTARIWAHILYYNRG
jgi:hypothetical protein